jgi:16S rRNA (uracil1498-N3)-methyltransferase
MRSILPAQGTAQVTLAIGPEGGWTDEEFSTALSVGFHETALGGLILRTETAVIAALAGLNYALG